VDHAIKRDTAVSKPMGKIRSARFKLLARGLCLSALLLAGCKTDYSLYEGHRGKYPADYKDKVRAAIEKGWPEPRKFRIVAITEPIEGFAIAKNYWHPKTFRDYWKYGAWLGCIHIEGIKNRGADFAEMDIPYQIERYGTAVALEDEPNCRQAPYKPWNNMKDGEEARGETKTPEKGNPTGFY
jgi:hypothetical protein